MRHIVMLGTAFDTKGGIAAVVNSYRAQGLFARWPIRYLATHCDGGIGAKLAIALRAYCRFAGLLLAGRVAAVHVHGASRASFWRKSPLLALAFIAARPTMFHLHGGGFKDFYRDACGRVGRAWVRLVLRRAARVVVLSDGWQDWVRTIEPRARTMVIPNPAPAFHGQRCVEPDTAPSLLFLGALVERKGVFDLVQAMRVLVARYPDLRLVLAGSGADGERLAASIAQAGLRAHVSLPGWVSAATREQLLARTAVFVLPSYFEALPVSLLEAMAAGVPVVATRVGSVPEAVAHGVDGVLIAPGDVDALTASIDGLLADPARRVRMGLAGAAKIAARFGPEQTIVPLETIYAALLDPGAAGRAGES